ncbi:ParB domain-containing protein [Planctomycetales bacterium 10988]|nr:ParB domain-containing protein [Planctomycetales bacterium 10988]
MAWKNRIRELRTMPANQLMPHPHNWRGHPPVQRQAMQQVLQEIGIAGAVLARKDEEGRVHLIDGHLRTELLGEMEIPVLLLDVDETEAAKLLLSFDPITGLAESDPALISELIASLPEEDRAFAESFEKLITDNSSTEQLPEMSCPEVSVPAVYQVLVECEDEAAQREIYERMRQEGYRCRVLTL